MRGHEGVIKMRMQGLAPVMVNIDDYEFKSPLIDWETHNDSPTICVNKENIESLDLRFLVGMLVSVSSCSEDRAKRLFNACKRAGAKTVASAHSFMDGEVSKTGWTEIYHG